MTHFITQCELCPPVDTAMGQRAPRECHHGVPYRRASSLRSVGVGVGQPPRAQGEKRTGVDSSTPKPGRYPFLRGNCRTCGNRPGVICDLCGNGLESKPKKRKAGLKRSEPKRDWSPALEKVEEEGCCRICKRTDRKLDAAHILGREHDEPKLGADGQPLKELLVIADRIIPACGPYPLHCHGAMHRKEVDVLRYLTLEEQVQAVRDAGSVEAARLRLTWAPGVAA